MKKSWLIGGLAVAAVAVAAGLALLYNLPLDHKDRAPLQPLLAFSHKVHAGVNGIHCLFCHRYAAQSPVAGIPAVSFCMMCHPLFGLEIEELETYVQKRQPIPWIRVYSLPDHVYFPHMMHVRAAIACATCHGDVTAVEPLTRFVDLKMGWCLNCHRQHKASIDCWTCHI